MRFRSHSLSRQWIALLHDVAMGAVSFVASIIFTFFVKASAFAKIMNAL